MKKKGLEYYIKDEPTDYISSIRFHEKYNHLLLVSSWDCYVRLYDVDENSLRTKWKTSDPNLASAYLVGKFGGKLTEPTIARKIIYISGCCLHSVRWSFWNA